MKRKRARKNSEKDSKCEFDKKKINRKTKRRIAFINTFSVTEKKKKKKTQDETCCIEKKFS